MSEDSAIHSTDFTRFISSPLKAVVGTVLLGIDFFHCNAGVDDFLAHSPNSFSVVLIRLKFESSVLQVFPGWRRDLRGDENSYHIELSIEGAEPGISGTPFGDYEWISMKCGDYAYPWVDLISKIVVAGEIYGNDESPQALRLIFQTNVVVICLGGGDPSHPLIIGDSDELSVFDDVEWRDESKYIFKPWRKLLRVG